MNVIVILLAYLWGAYGIPWRCPLSVGSHPSSVIRFVSSVSTITTKNNQDIKSIFSANVYHFLDCPSQVLVAPPTSVIWLKLWLENHIFTFSTSSLKQPAGAASYYARRLLKPRPIQFVQITVKLHLQAFGRTLNMEKCKNLVSVYKTFKNLLLQINSTEFLDIAHK